jgi:hypothetical protein
MNRQRKWSYAVLAALMLWASASIADESKKPVPPTFSLKSHPMNVLSNYPLGVINKQNAFAHHGGAIRKMTLPNGNQGWLYKAGEEEGVPSIYVLEFSNEDFVIDVLHKDHRYKIGHSALQYQYLSDLKLESGTLGQGSIK